jgi:hypothetical protein
MIKRSKSRKSDGISPRLRIEWDETTSSDIKYDYITRQTCSMISISRTSPGWAPETLKGPDR